MSGPGLGPGANPNRFKTFRFRFWADERCSKDARATFFHLFPCFQLFRCLRPGGQRQGPLWMFFQDHRVACLCHAPPLGSLQPAGGPDMCAAALVIHAGRSATFPGHAVSLWKRLGVNCPCKVPHNVGDALAPGFFDNVRDCLGFRFLFSY